MEAPAPSRAKWASTRKLRSLATAVGHSGAAGLLTIGIVFALVITAGLGLRLWHDRSLTLEQGEQVASNLAKVLEEQTRGTIQAVDLTLAGIVDAMHLAPAQNDHDPNFERALRRKKAALPYIRALFVVGPDGFITQDTDPDTPRVSLADRGYFRVHAENPRLGLYIGPPLISRSVGRWFVSMSRRVQRPDGTFGGIVVAAIEPSYFEAFYGALALDQGDNIALFSEDGLLIARYPRVEELVGKSHAQFELFKRLKESRSGTYTTTSRIDNIHRIFSYRALDPYPLVVTVGLATDTLLSQWRRTVVGAVAGAAVIAILIALLTSFVWRQHRHREQARERLTRHQKLEALGQLTSGVAHDFRNLLMVISASATLMQKHGLGGEFRKYSDAITAAVERGNDLIARMLAFARQQDLSVKAEDANAMLRSIETLLRYGAGSTARVVLDLAPDLPLCLADRALFDTAVLNLVVNARDAMPSGGEVRITTTSCSVKAGLKGGGGNGPHPGDYVCVTVRDNGEGMTPAIRRRALDPYFTTKAERGTGLGLSQVYGFVQQIGGDLKLESEVGVGTSVHLYFPRAIEAAGPAEQVA